MTKLTKAILFVFLLWTVDYGLWTSVADASVPRLINYQAKLTNAAGEPLDGAYDVTFKIYDAETAGNLLWQETHAGLVVQQGLFSVLLGSVAPLSLPFTQNYWLAIKVGNDSEMTPRQQIAASGYAINSEHAESADKIKASNSDSAAGYLSQKADSATLEIDTATQKLRIKDAGVSYNKLDNDMQRRIAKAWINFDGRGAIYIRDSYNVTAIVDDGVGDYRIFWDKDFANTNYCVVASSAEPRWIGFAAADSYAVDYVGIRTRDADGGYSDYGFVSVVAMGD